MALQAYALRSPLGEESFAIGLPRQEGCPRPLRSRAEDNQSGQGTFSLIVFASVCFAGLREA